MTSLPPTASDDVALPRESILSWCSRSPQPGNVLSHRPEQPVSSHVHSKVSGPMFAIIWARFF